MKFYISVFFENLSKNFKFSKHNEYFTCRRIWRTFLSYPLTSLQNKKCFRKSLQIKSKHKFYVQFFFSKIVLVDNVEIFCRARQATDDNIVHAHCMLDAYGYKHTLRIYNTYCFSTATMVVRTCLNVTSYILCLSCYYSLISVDFYYFARPKSSIH